MRIGAIDIGGTKTTCAILDKNGGILASVTMPTLCADANAFFEICATRMEECAASLGLRITGLYGVGISLPGMVNTDGVLLNAPFAGWRMIPVSREFSSLLGISNVRCDCDVNACALAESYFGGFANLLWVTVSTGIGGGIVIDGEVYRGADSVAGEIGHMKVEYEVPRLCSCGQYGCAEAHASGTALTRTVLEKVAVEPSYAGLFQHKVLPMDAIGCSVLAKEGEGRSIGFFNETGDYLGRMLANAINLLNPERVMIGGGMARSFSLLENAIHARIDRSVVSFIRNTPIEVTRLGYEAALIGAATLVIRERKQ